MRRGSRRDRGECRRNRRGLQPVPLPLERIGGQVHRVNRYPAENRGPVQRRPVHVCFRHRRQKTLDTALTAPQRGQYDGFVAGFPRGFLQTDGQHRMRAHLDEDVVSVLQQRPRRLLEVDGVTQVAVPVPGIEQRRVHQIPGHGRAEGDVRSAGDDSSQLGQQPLPDRFDSRGVRGVVDRDLAGPHPLRLTQGKQFPHRLGFTGDDRRTRAVPGGNRNASIPVGEALVQLRHRQ